MRCLFILLLTATFCLHSYADEFLGHNTLRYRKVLDINTGKVEDDFSRVQDMPKFPGGDEAFFHQIYDMLGFSLEKEPIIDGNTIVKFLITPEGKIQDVTIENSSNEEYDKKIVNTLSSLPSFLPPNEPNTYYYAWMSIYCPK